MAREKENWTIRRERGGLSGGGEKEKKYVWSTLRVKNNLEGRKKKGGALLLAI